MNLQLKQVCLFLLASLAVTRAEPSLPNTNINEIDDKMPEKPEPRQIGQIGQIAQMAQLGAMMPYTWLQPSQAALAAAGPSLTSSWGSSSPSWWSSLGSGQSFLSLFKPNASPIGGRRSSLTSRLRNLMNALFYRRETSTPYLTSGSNSMYSYRPPPFGFSSSFPTTGLASALGNQNLYGSASFNRPVVLPNYGSSPTDTWSNYKQYASSSNLPASWTSGSSGSGSGSAPLWQSGSSSGSGSQYSALASSSYPTYSSGSGSNTAYQASASNLYPQTSYQRSSISTYSKPQPSASTSVSSSVSVSSSSSAASPSNPKSVPFQS